MFGGWIQGKDSCREGKESDVINDKKQESKNGF